MSANQYQTTQQIIRGQSRSAAIGIASLLLLLAMIAILFLFFLK